MIQSLLRPVAYFSMFPVFGVGALCFYVALRVRVLGVGKIEGERLARLFIHHGARLLFAVLRWFSLVDARVSVVPRSGLRNRSAVVVGNHPSVLDAMLFLSFVPNGVCVMKRALLRVPIIAGFSKLAGYIPYAEAPEMIHAARRTLRDGGSIIIFPEGTRSPEGRLGEFHRGQPVSRWRREFLLRSSRCLWSQSFWVGHAAGCALPESALCIELCV